MNHRSVRAGAIAAGALGLFYVVVRRPSGS